MRSALSRLVKLRGRGYARGGSYRTIAVMHDFFMARRHPKPHCCFPSGHPNRRGDVEPTTKHLEATQ
jgi:hypothetical protein